MSHQTTMLPFQKAQVSLNSGFTGQKPPEPAPDSLKFLLIRSCLSARLKANLIEVKYNFVKLIKLIKSRSFMIQLIK